jgi:hypothetical protein
MPGPFPGMDPFLEHPALWPGVHQGLVAVARATLNTLLPQHYVADIGERVYIVQPERGICPDVVILEHPSAQPPTEQVGAATAAMVSDPPSICRIGLLPPTGLSSLILAVSADVPPGRDARSRG